MTRRVLLVLAVVASAAGSLGRRAMASTSPAGADGPWLADIVRVMVRVV
jgi:hypothetical protein